MKADNRKLVLRILLFAFVCAYVWTIISCSSKPTDLRTLAPADALVYLESNDLAATLQPMIDSKPFTDAAKSKPDLSALKGVQISVAVTGFETSEEKVDDDRSVGKIRPHFVAIADTHAWNFQAAGFAEKKLGSFVANIYDTEPKLEQSDKFGGRYFTWTAGDRKAYALVIDSLIYFSNDESSIEESLSVRRGESDSILKTGKLQPASPDLLASGYVSNDGIAQIANSAALKLASDSSDEAETQKFVASVVPNILRSSITDASWSMKKGFAGIEDEWRINMPSEVAKPLREGLAPAPDPNFDVTAYLTSEDPVTVYNFKDPHDAWETVLAEVHKTSGRDLRSLLPLITSALVEPYGIRDPDGFVSNINPVVATSTCGDATESRPVIVSAPKTELAEASLLARTSVQSAGERGSVFKDADGEYAAFRDTGVIMSGDTGCVEEKLRKSNFGNSSSAFQKRLTGRTGSVVTFGIDRESAMPIAETVSAAKDDRKSATAYYTTETAFDDSGIKRTTISDLGFVGWIIAQVSDD